MTTEPTDRDPEHCGGHACISSCGCVCSECRAAVKIVFELHGPGPKEQSLFHIAIERILCRLSDLEQPKRDEAAFVLMLGIVGTLDAKKTGDAVLPLLFPEYFPKKP